MEFTSSSFFSSRYVLLTFFFFLFSCLIYPTTSIRDVDLENPVIDFTPSHLGGHISTSRSQASISCERVRVVGVSRWFSIKRYANSFRVTLTPSVQIPERLHSKIEVCFFRNASLGPCQCDTDEWKTIQKGQWSGVMSPYEDRYVDVKFVDGTSGSITVSVEEEFQQWRLYCLVFGFLLLLSAPIVSDWVPFYYSSSMAIGVLLVVLILLFQGMKLLPTGRKSALYFTIYGSLIGLGSVLVNYFSMLINSILVNFGLSEDMYNPVSIFAGVGIILSGAALGYWMVRKFVISKDGTVDAGIAQFVKWAVRIVAITSILQSTLDTRLAILALASAWGLCSLITSKCRGPALMWLRQAKQTSRGRKSAEFLSRSAGKAYGRTSWGSPKRATHLSVSPTRGYGSPSSLKGVMLTPQRDYYSTFHKTPKRKRFSKKEWDDFTMESTKEALADLASSPEFTDWVVENADRIQIQPQDSSDDSMDSGAVSSEETVMESESKGGLFSWYSQALS
ncbi:hypothetical protein AQUCO_00900557v1 [Aquilegia coerulea]|uniref:Transmembrane protein 194 n=1 Tax=Aquilegia coerulea TaxID=218851 RepID=A0A2G5EEB3_AQUCA|nr:hypothetical protein AQUCO_00900557v1 [Aquilegia coerulea]